MTEKFSSRASSSYLLENIDVWTADGIQKNARIWVEDGRFKGINAPATTGQLERIDGQGLVVMPAGVDAQAHLRVPGQAQKETAQTGLLAALKGGYSAVLTMPNTQPTIDNIEILKRAQDEVLGPETDFGVHVFWSAAITKNLNSDHLVAYEELVRAGVRAFTNDGLGVASDEVMDQVFAKLETLGVPLLQHAEFLGHGGALAPGPIQRQVGAAPYPDEPEWKMVERDLRELRKHPKARYHVLHVSSRKTLELVKKAKAEGLNVTCEVSPHHLYFNTETIDPHNNAFKMNPPIRGPEDQKALWQGLQDGTIDFVATDHAPHETLMKTGSFDKVAFGTVGLETTIAVLLYGLKQGHLTPRRFVEVFSVRPAQFLRLPKGFGEWAVEAPFHAVWLDVNAAETIYTEDKISSLSKNSCFLGAKLSGRIAGAFHEQTVYVFP